MKKCPFCGADIEENAQFCLYCMTSLTEKEQILVHKKKKPQGLLILAAIVGAAVILLLLLFGKRAAPDTDGQTTDTSMISSTTEADSTPTTVTLVFNYTNISSTGTEDFPRTGLGVIHRASYLEPGESGTYVALSQTSNPYGNYLVTFG